MAHDCWFCKFNRALIVVGFLAIAFVCFVASAEHLFLMHWKLAGKEFLGSLFSLGMIWVGLKVLRGWNRLIDRIFSDGE